MRRAYFPVVVAALVVAPLAAVAGSATAFTKISEHYEAIRQALLHDSVEGVAEHARAIAEAAQALGSESSPTSAGVTTDKGAECARLLPEVEKAATELAAASSLEQARQAFGELSTPLVRYRDMASGTLPIVVYCPMAKKAWLQPAGEIGNPYYGQGMPRCGQVVSK